MKSIKTKKVTIGLLSLLLVYFSACSDFEAINTNNNFPTKVKSETLLNPLIRKLAQTQFAYAFEQDGLGLSRHIAQTNFNDVEQYAFSDKLSVWNQLYTLLSNTNEFISIAKRENNNSSIALGYIIKAFIGSQLTDLWTNIPFFEAALNNGNTTPVYDTQKEIYTAQNGIVDLLSQATTILTNNTDNLPDDLLFKANREKWIKFSNSLKLRYLIRISNRIGDSSGLDILKEIKNLIAINNLMQSNADNALLPFLDSNPNQNPVFKARPGSFVYRVMSQEMDSILNLFSDPRREIWFQPTAASQNSDNPQYIGFPVGTTLTTQKELGFEGSEVSLLGAYFRATPNQCSAVLMHSAEVKFLMAEAIARGFATGNAALHYNKGINLSMKYYGVASTPDYLSQRGVAYNESTAIEQIMTQKWLALFFVGYESWFDFLRTELPAWKPLLDNRNATASGEIPSRFFYPNDESVLNSKNYQQAISVLGGNDINIKHWWE
ncbi:MAG: SusD/RagB family nutrient-binding outer membrane lipoprotein [Tenacibaculum sp.]